jgi:hypothetical protein
VKSQERIGSNRQGNTGRLAVRTLTRLKPLKVNPVSGGRVPALCRLSGISRDMDNARRGRQVERPGRLRGRMKTLKGEAQGRYRRETKPEGSREERGVRRLRKPVGAAQSGEANPASVASRFLRRRRVMKPHEGGLFTAVRRGSYSGAEPKSMRGRDGASRARPKDERRHLIARFARPRAERVSPNR